MTFAFAPSTNIVTRGPKPSQRLALVASFVLFACCLMPLRAASADALTRPIHGVIMSALSGY